MPAKQSSSGWKEKSIISPEAAILEIVKPDRSLDIRGLVCPFTFVKAKLAMESMEVGQVLEIVLDCEEASRSIPRAMKEHGQTLLKTEKITDRDWILLIRKEKE